MSEEIEQKLLWTLSDNVTAHYKYVFWLFKTNIDFLAATVQIAKECTPFREILSELSFFLNLFIFFPIKLTLSSKFVFIKTIFKNQEFL